MPIFYANIPRNQGISLKLVSHQETIVWRLLAFLNDCLTNLSTYLTIVVFVILRFKEMTFHLPYLTSFFCVACIEFVVLDYIMWI